MVTGCEMKIRDISSICSTLEMILKPGFGPNGLNTMFSTPTGLVMIASDSWTILSSLSLSHPAARMIMDSVKTHLKRYGDGGKTFIMMMLEIFRSLATISSSDNERQRLIRGLAKLRNHLPSIVSDLTSECGSLDLHNTDIATVKEHCTRMIMVQLGGSFPSVTCKHLCNVLVSFLFERLTDIISLPHVIVDVLDNFDVCCLEAVGYPPTSSQVVEGFVIQREFQTAVYGLSSKSNVRFLLVGCSLDGEDDDDGVVFSVKSKSSLHAALTHKSKLTALVVQKLKEDRIDLIISSVNISKAASLACHDANISTVHMVDDEDMTRLSVLFGVVPLCSLHEYLTDTHRPIGVVSKCGYVLISGQRFVHLIPDSSCVFVSRGHNTHLMKHILVAGHSRGACCQVRTLFQNCLRCLRSWLSFDAQHYLHKPPLNISKYNQNILSVTTCGTFELFLYFKIKELISTCEDDSYIFACKLLAKALLRVPLAIQNNSYSPQAKSLNVCHILKESRGKSISKLQIDPRSGRLIMASDSNGIEPLVPKLALLHNLLDLTIQILRIDKLVAVKMCAE